MPWWDEGFRGVVIVALKVVLVAATLVCLASIGGAMVVAFPVLVPLHWFAAEKSGPYATAGWALLAALSLLEAGWILSYLVTANATTGAVVGAVAALVAIVLFMRRGMDRAAARRAAVASTPTD